MLLSLTGCTSAPVSTPAPEPTPTPEPLPEAVFTIELTAGANEQSLDFDKSILRAPADTDIAIVFANKDNCRHNLAIYTSKEATESIFIGEIVGVLETITYRFRTPINPGTYHFRCDVHHTIMNGKFIVCDVPNYQ